jgi:hypothetical protein
MMVTKRAAPKFAARQRVAQLSPAFTGDVTLLLRPSAAGDAKWLRSCPRVTAQVLPKYCA